MSNKTPNWEDVAAQSGLTPAEVSAERLEESRKALDGAFRDVIETARRELERLKREGE